VPHEVLFLSYLTVTPEESGAFFCPKIAQSFKNDAIQ